MSEMSAPYQTSKNNSGSQTNLPKALDIKTMIRLLVIIYDRLSKGLVFSQKSLVRMPYILMDQKLLNWILIKRPAFSTIRLKFKFACYVKQLIDFEINAEFDNFDADISHQMPPFYYFSEIILHNYRNSELATVYNQSSHGTDSFSFSIA